MNIYFAGSIRGGRDDAHLYKIIVKKLSKYGKVLTEHVAYESLSEMGEGILEDRYIHERDIAWLKQSHVVVAEITTPSLGVGYEIAKAEELRKPMLCLHHSEDSRRLSPMITGSERSTIVYYGRGEELDQILDKFFSNFPGKLE